MAERVKNAIRPYDLLGRYGGEEFVLFALDITRANVRKYAERLRLKICNQPMDFEDIKIKVSASFGIAPVVVSKTMEEIIQSADEALYRAKEEGRNRVVLAETASKPEPAPKVETVFKKEEPSKAEVAPKTETPQNEENEPKPTVAPAPKEMPAMAKPAHAESKIPPAPTKEKPAPRPTATPKAESAPAPKEKPTAAKPPKTAAPRIQPAVLLKEKTAPQKAVLSKEKAAKPVTITVTKTKPAAIPKEKAEPKKAVSTKEKPAAAKVAKTETASKPKSATIAKVAPLPQKIATLPLKE
jgi:hypothetical protein